jgi:hypothetical protein
MVRPGLHLAQAFVAWMAPFLAAFCHRSRDTAALRPALVGLAPEASATCPARSLAPTNTAQAA